MASELMEALMGLCQEKHIDELYLLDRLEESLAKSYSDQLHLEYGVRVTIDRESGHLYVYKLIPKGEKDPETGEYEEFDEELIQDVGKEESSRLAALSAKNAINQIVRDAAREEIYEEFKDRIGDIITGTVLQGTSNFTILKIREGVEAELPHYDTKRFERERNERPSNERYGHNQRLKALIIDVRDPHTQKPRGKGEQYRASIVVSRTHPDLLKRLFEIEVPEIYDGLVEVKSIAREPGKRSKIAVSSLEERLDPVGACVGPRGSRVRNVVSELRGERVDIIPYSEDPAEFIAAALSPAEILQVIVDKENSFATVIVDDDQLSLAIGKEGQNARLAARLTGYHIDIKNISLAQDIMAKLAEQTAADLDLIDDEQDGRCHYVDAEGHRCRNQARPGSRYCGVHANAEETVDKEDKAATSSKKDAAKDTKTEEGATDDSLI